MPIGYLIAVTLTAVPTVAALAPVRRGRTLGRLSWRLGFQVTELPQLVAAWVVADTALAAVQGDLGTPGGMVGVMVAALILAALGVVLRRALYTERVARTALSEGPGSGRPTESVPNGAGSVRRRRPWLRLLLLPLAVRRRDVVRQPGVAYGTAGRQNLLDVYLPRSGVTTGPCLVYVHGGGYRGGRKNNEARALLYRLASQGWVCVSANYRLPRDAPYPAALVDGKRVIGWMREHASGYGADASQIVVAGSSAGAHLAAMVALTPNVSELQPGFEATDTHVSAAICLYGFYVTPTWVEREPGAPSAPLELLHDGAPPMLVAHGTHDSFVPVTAARDFVERFRTAAPDSRLVYLELPGAQHSFDLYDSVRFRAVVDAAESFTAEVLVRGVSPEASG